MKIFVTGSTGYVGLNVACALRRAGHDVWGLARTAAKARLLGAHEIHPILGTLQQPETFRGAAEICSVIIHAAADYTQDMLALDARAVEALLSAAKSGAQPKCFIYTSGVWVYGGTAGRMVDETTAPNPAKMVSRRPAIEQMVLSAPGVRGLVIRPGCVYGKQGGLTGVWFAGAVKENAVRVIGDGTNHWAMVHVDDLSDAYLRAAESSLQGEVFNITDRSRCTVTEMAYSAARVAGYTGRIEHVHLSEAAKTMGDFAECLALDQHVDSRKAVRLLGWQPRHGGFVDGVASYYISWKTSQEA